MKHARRWLAALVAAVGLVATTAGAGTALRVTIAGASGRVPRSKPVKLSSKVRISRANVRLSYTWESLAGPSLPYDLDINGPTLGIPVSALEAGMYKLRLRVRAVWEDPKKDPSSQRIEATGDVSFKVNTPPSGGTCAVKHKWVKETFVRLSIHSKGWKDPDDKKLQYRYSVMIAGKKRVLKS